MSIFSRMGTAVKFMLHGETAYDIIPTYQTQLPSYPISNFRNNVLQGYRKNELVYTCISKKADVCAQPRLLVYNKKGEELPDHPLRQLLKKPNPFMTEFDFYAWHIMLFDLAGRVYFEKVPSPAGRIVQLWPLRPDWVKPIPDPQKFIGAYEYWVPGREKVFLDPDRILDVKIADPLNFYQGLAPVSVAGRVVDVDSAVTDYVKLFFERGAIPAGMIKSKSQKIPVKDRKNMQKRFLKWHGGYQQWIKPLVLDKDAEYIRMGLTGKEMQFGELDARDEARICMILKTPPVIAGAKIGLDKSTFNNYASAQKAFFTDTINPQLIRIKSELENDLVPNFGGDLELGWDFSQVVALQEEKDAVWKRGTEAFRASAITRNMFLRSIGEDPVADGDVFIQSLTVEAIPAKQFKGACFGHDHKELTTPENAPDDSTRRGRERELRAATIDFFEGQKGRITKAIQQ